MKAISCLLLFLCLGLYLPAQQSSPLVMGRVETLDSRILGESRTLNVFLPDGYHPDSAQRYPVVYVLDGGMNEDFPHIAGLVQFLTMIQAMPASIVVGVVNVNRKRDFTHPTTVAEDLEWVPGGGGSEKFIQFLRNEVQPLIRQRYKTTEETTLIGQSLGGLLGTEILLKQPDMFRRYILVSPSLWWDDQSLLKSAAQYIRGHVTPPEQVFLTVGSEGPLMESVAMRLSISLKTYMSKKTKVYWQPLPQENHATILHNAVYQAFLKLYPQPPAVH